MGLSELPPELLLEISGYLGPADLANFATASHQMHDVAIRSWGDMERQLNGMNGSDLQQYAMQSPLHESRALAYLRKKHACKKLVWAKDNQPVESDMFRHITEDTGVVGLLGYIEDKEMVIIDG